MTKYVKGNADWMETAVVIPAPSGEVQENSGQNQQPQPQRRITGLVMDGRGQPYCPVFVKPKANGAGRHITAYLVSEILDVDEYVDLIDCLFTATEDDDIFIYIDSPGGYISAGSIISSAIHHSHANVYTVARGLCASAACLIHNSAKEGHAIVEDMGVLMIHMSLHGDSGVSSLIAKRASDQVRYVNETLLSQAVEMGYLLPNELDQIQNGKEIYISAKDFKARIEAKNNGEKVEEIEADSTVVGDSTVAAVEDFGYTEDQIRFYIPNTESLGRSIQASRLLDPSSLGPADMAAKLRELKANALRIKVSLDGKNFRIYMPSDLMFSRAFIINLSYFLDTRSEDETVTFVLGAKLMDNTAAFIGAVISAMRSCKAKVITLAAGYCSIPETMLWVYGEERKVLRYGALTFGITEVVERVPKFKDYYENYLRRAQEIGILNDADLKTIGTMGTVFKMYNELK